MYKVCYITSSRADYGRIRNYLKYLENDNEINLNVFLTGAILEEKFGAGYKMIEEDNLKICKKIKLEFESTKNIDIIKNMAILLNETSKYFDKNKYDLAIILGDRYEMFSVATSLAMNNIPILHFHGGEITLGNYDEFIRHSITKMSTYHFTSTEEYRKRVIQMGENPKRVFNVGAIGIENCKKIDIKKINKQVLSLKEKEYFVILFHPETLTDENPKEQIETILKSINHFENYKFIFIGTNADTGSNLIRKMINEYVDKNKNSIYYENLNPSSYHYLLKKSIAIIGNSSSGIIEAPTLGCYTINIGMRQEGRIKAKSIYDVKCKENEIVNTIKKILKLKYKNEFNNPYFKSNTDVTSYKLTKMILKKDHKQIKKFYDINYELGKK